MPRMCRERTLFVTPYRPTYFHAALFPYYVHQQKYKVNGTSAVWCPHLSWRHIGGIRLKLSIAIMEFLQQHRPETADQTPIMQI